MHGPELFLVFTKPLEGLGLVYMVTGSVASIVYGQPRMTHDIDLVLALPTSQIDMFLAAFAEEEFYCPPRESLRLETTRQQRGHFNLIHHATGFKADFFLVGEDPLHQWALKNRRRFELTGKGSIWLAPMEYIVVRKLEYFREGGSNKHLKDIVGMMKLSGSQLNHKELETWLHRLGLAPQWQMIVEKLRQD